MNIEDRIKQEINDESDLIDTTFGIMLVISVVAFCAFSLGLVWQLSQPWVAEVLAIVWGWVI